VYALLCAHGILSIPGIDMIYFGPVPLAEKEEEMPVQVYRGIVTS
jgi:hypothetical protein